MVAPWKFLPALLVAAALHAPAQIHQSCGNSAVRFRIRQTDPPSQVKPQPGQALVYFIAQNFGGIITPTTRLGLDGDWVGATHGSSWFYFQVAPGVHHLCAETVTPAESDYAQLHFTAQSGEVYYFDAKRLSWFREGLSWSDMTLLPVDGDEGQLLVRTNPYNTSQRRQRH